MALPLLLGLLGSGLASTGMLGGIGALTAGAIGSGLGTAIETGDIGKGLSSGLLSFLGGKFIGDAFAADPLSKAGVDAATKAATDPAIQAATAPKEGLGGFFKGTFQDPTKSLMADPSLLSPGLIGKETGVGLNALTSPQVLPYVGGAQVGTLMSTMAERGGMKKSSTGSSNYRKAPAPGMTTRRPPAGYRPGYDPEFDYQFPIYGVQHMAEGGIVGLGGEMPMDDSMDKKIVSDAVAAIRGEVEDPRIPLGIFLKRYGEEALRRLVDEVLEGGMTADSGFVEGVGDGMSDEIPASSDSGDVALSDGEFVVPADVVSHLGNGSSGSGAKRLMDMMNRVRAERTGSRAAPDELDYREMMPA